MEKYSKKSSQKSSRKKEKELLKSASKSNAKNNGKLGKGSDENEESSRKNDEDPLGKFYVAGNLSQNGEKLPKTPTRSQNPHILSFSNNCVNGNPQGLTQKISFIPSFLGENDNLARKEYHFYEDKGSPRANLLQAASDLALTLFTPFAPFEGNGSLLLKLLDFIQNNLNKFEEEQQKLKKDSHLLLRSVSEPLKMPEIEAIHHLLIAFDLVYWSGGIKNEKEYKESINDVTYGVSITPNIESKIEVVKNNISSLLAKNEAPKEIHNESGVSGLISHYRMNDHHLEEGQNSRNSNVPPYLKDVYKDIFDTNEPNSVSLGNGLARQETASFESYLPENQPSAQLEKRAPLTRSQTLKSPKKSPIKNPVSQKKSPKKSPKKSSEKKKEIEKEGDSLPLQKQFTFGDIPEALLPLALADTTNLQASISPGEIKREAERADRETDKDQIPEPTPKKVDLVHKDFSVKFEGNELPKTRRKVCRKIYGMLTEEFSLDKEMAKVATLNLEYRIHSVVEFNPQKERPYLSFVKRVIGEIKSRPDPEDCLRATLQLSLQDFEASFSKFK